MNTPVLDVAPQQLDVLASVRKDEVVGGALAVVQKIMFDRLGLVAETKDKIRVAVVGVIFHHMPQDGHVADFDQRFRNVLRMIFQPHSKAAAKEYDFHKVILSELPKLFTATQRGKAATESRNLTAKNA